MYVFRLHRRERLSVECPYAFKFFKSCSTNLKMRSKYPCSTCGKNSCPSDFVFKNISCKCVCKSCYNRQKRSEKVSCFREASQAAKEKPLQTVGVSPVVINLEGT